MSELRRITERYRLDKQVAVSDAGSVFRATDIQSGATVAVKLINSDGGESDEQRERFLTSAATLQSLQHPSLPTIVDFGFTTAGSAFLVTELLHGSSFEEVAGSAPGRVLSLLLLVVDGLEAMGARGISTRNLCADNVLVVPGGAGEQVKILGLGSAVLETGAMPTLDGYPEDLRAFGLLACRMLRVQTDFKIGIPLEVAVELEDIEALRALLEAALHGDPERHYPSWAEVRKALRAALFGDQGPVRTEAFATHPGLTADGAPAATVRIHRLEPAPTTAPQPRADDLDGTVMVVDEILPVPRVPPPAREALTSTLEIPRAAMRDVMARPATSAEPPLAMPQSPLPMPSPPPPPFVPPAPPPVEVGVDTIARPPEVRVVPAAAQRQRRLLLMIGVPVAAVLLLAVGLALLWALRRPPEPPPKPKVVARPVSPLPVVAPPPAPAPLPIHPQLALAQISLGAGDLKGVKAALDAIAPGEQEVFRPDERDLYQHLMESLTPLKREELAARLAQALERGDLRQLRTLAAAAPAAEMAGLPTDVQANLARARKIVDVEAKLSRAQRSGNSLDVIHQADALLAELPRSGRAAEQKERAAASIETAADSEIDSGQYDAALNRLNGLRQAWPDRPGLAARLDRIAAEHKADQDMESLLAAATAAEKSNKPLEAQRMLAGVKPNRRYAERFQEARQRVDGEIAQLDRQPPEIKPRGATPEYEKGKTASIPLKVTDDFGVKAVEGWARPEKGQYVKVNIRHLNGSDYVMDVPEDVHHDETIEYYATATDGSGHVGQLASADHPNKVKRKSWLKKILGEKDGG
jgi:hypothetical protein